MCSEVEGLGTKSTYYMTGNYNGCLWVTKGYCDMDPDSLECYECTAPHVEEPISGLCSHMFMAADQTVNDQHEDCVGNSYNQVMFCAFDVLHFSVPNRLVIAMYSEIETFSEHLEFI